MSRSKYADSTPCSTRTAKYKCFLSISTEKFIRHSSSTKAERFPSDTCNFILPFSILRKSNTCWMRCFSCRKLFLILSSWGILFLYVMAISSIRQDMMVIGVGYVREVTQLGLCQFLTLLLFYLYDFQFIAQPDTINGPSVTSQQGRSHSQYI